MTFRELINSAHRRISQWSERPAIETLKPPAPPPYDPRDATIRMLANALGDSKIDANAITAMERQQYREFVHELQEARSLRGSGPWLQSDPRTLHSVSLIARESEFMQNSQGAMGDMELALQNVDWRREINFAWLQFSRWGIQQIILISRLYYLKNPIIRRLIDVCSLYVFARGVEVSSPDESANEVLKDFFQRNQCVFGQSALVEQQKAKYYDGNLFWVFFPDDVKTGQTNVRTIDAVEIQDIVTNPEDVDEEWFFFREWNQRSQDPLVPAEKSIETKHAWYPALGYDPAAKPQIFGDYPVMWDHPILHRKCGTVGKWTFGCPRIYPALDWAKAARKFLEACAAVKAALATISMSITTKGGQQALAGIKQQLETTVATGTSGWWDQNPTPVNGSVWASGPGTTLAAFKSSGEGGDPEEVRQYKLMCCMVVGVPETFLADVSTGNLATATSLDRPTELMFLAEQESWREDFVKIATFALETSNSATGDGSLRESTGGRKMKFREARRKARADGTWRYVEVQPEPDVIEIQVNFPAIREGDVPALVTATVQAMTLGNASGEVVGIDEKAGVLKLGEYLGIEDNGELVDSMYPESSYEVDREAQKQQKADQAKELAAAKPAPVMAPKPGAVKEAIDRLSEAISKWK